jgi:hypothetical protein
MSAPFLVAALAFTGRWSTALEIVVERLNRLRQAIEADGLEHAFSVITWRFRSWTIARSALRRVSIRFAPL